MPSRESRTHILKFPGENPAKGIIGNGSFRSYSRLDPGSFRSYSLSIRSFRPGSFRPEFGDVLVGRFGPFYFIYSF